MGKKRISFERRERVKVDGDVLAVITQVSVAHRNVRHAPTLEEIRELGNPPGARPDIEDLRSDLKRACDKGYLLCKDDKYSIKTKGGKVVTPGFYIPPE